MKAQQPIAVQTSLGEQHSTLRQSVKLTNARLLFWCSTCFGQLATNKEGKEVTLLGTVTRGMYAPMLAWWLSYFPVEQVRGG